MAVRRASFIVLVIAAATVLPPLSAGVASGAGPEGGTVVRVALALKASNGLHAHLENSEDGTVTSNCGRRIRSSPTKLPAMPPKRG